MFCDLVGSTELSGILEPETLRSVVLRYFDVMRDQIEAHGGLVEKFIGDAVMAVFGIPTVHENDAHRAAAAALDMVAALAELNEDLSRTLGCQLAVRIGINTGEVVATAQEGTNENLVSGEVVNVAARLEQNAGVGEVLIGPITRELLGTAATVDKLGPVTLKGKRDAVAAFRLTSLQPYAVDGHRAAFVGRESELGRLRAAWAGVRDGHGGRLVTVSGEAGIGKTRLLQEWLAGLPDGEALVGAGRCHPYRDEASLTPLGQALRQILEKAEDRSPLEHSDHVLRTGLLHDGTPGRSPESTYAATAAMLRGLDRPVALLFDDLQWADQMLLDGIAHVATALEKDRVLLLCSGRVETTVDLALAPLSTVEAHELAAGLLELQLHGPDLLTRVIERAEGNPLYLEQLLAMLEEGADADELPATVNAVLAARIDALRPAERTTLCAAAVIGRQFVPARVEALSDTVAPLAELVRRGLIEPVRGQDGCYRFSSGLLREVTYRGISKRRRADWHERLADTPGTGIATEGHHFEQAYLHRHELGLRDERTEILRSRAALALTEAARTALARADLSWSADLGQRALRLSTKDDLWWKAAAQSLGETWLATGRTVDGDQLLREVMAAAGDDQRAYAHAKLQLAALHPESGVGSAAEIATEALPVFQAAQDNLGLARAYVRLGQEQQTLGSYRKADDLLEAALQHSVVAKAAPERATALGAIGISLWQGPTPATEAVRQCQDLLVRYGSDHDIVVLTLNYPLANLFALQGLDTEAQECLNTANRFARDLGYAEAAAFVPLFTAGVEALAGRWEKAEMLLREAIAQCQATGNAGLLINASRDLARVLVRNGKRPDPTLLDGGDDFPPAEAADHLGARAITETDARLAVQLARAAVAAAETTDSPITRATAYLDLAQACRSAGVPSTAAKRAAEWFGRKGHVVGCQAAAAIGAV
ncbi:AAA family ATPase [Fodinicola feengrottensis]|uniref:AAA family ATPase n=1 Tax=Fodinicola feengrottensis TaxID=435914 RepID=A0ABP4S1N5_9ACTN